MNKKAITCFVFKFGIDEFTNNMTTFKPDNYTFTSRNKVLLWPQSNGLNIWCGSQIVASKIGRIEIVAVKLKICIHTIVV